MTLTLKVLACTYTCIYIHSETPRACTHARTHENLSCLSLLSVLFCCLFHHLLSCRRSWCLFPCLLTRSLSLSLCVFPPSLMDVPPAVPVPAPCLMMHDTPLLWWVGGLVGRWVGGSVGRWARTAGSVRDNEPHARARPERLRRQEH